MILTVTGIIRSQETQVPTFTIINNSTGDRAVTNVNGGGPWTLDSGSYPVSIGQTTNGFTHPVVLGPGQLDIFFSGTNLINVTVTKNGSAYRSSLNVASSQVNYTMGGGADNIQVNDIIVITIATP